MIEINDAKSDYFKIDCCLKKSIEKYRIFVRAMALALTISQLLK